MISDGPGAGTNRLGLSDYAVPFVRLTAPNTYAQGTLILSSPSAPKGLVEVGPEGTLGTGRRGGGLGGVLRLMGDHNIASNCAVTVRGGVILDAGVKARISSLTLGSSTFTTGLFTGTNGLGRLLSNGTFRLPATNLAPTIVLTTPANGAAFLASNHITLRAAAADTDSYIERVEFLAPGHVGGRAHQCAFRLHPDQRARRLLRFTGGRL